MKETIFYKKVSSPKDFITKATVRSPEPIVLLNNFTTSLNLSDFRVISKVDHRSYDRAKTDMIGQNLFARSS